MCGVFEPLLGALTGGALGESAGTSELEGGVGAISSELMLGNQLLLMNLGSMHSL